MKIGVLSDSHDNLEKIERAVELFNDKKVAKVIHGGDLISPFTSRIFKKLNVPLQAIFGNNDGEILGLKNIFNIQIQPLKLELDARKIIVIHEPVYLKELEKSSEFDVIIYGHTHKVDVKKGKNLILNPGETCGYLTGRATAAILDLAKLDVEIMEF